MDFMLKMGVHSQFTNVILYIIFKIKAPRRAPDLNKFVLLLAWILLC